MGLLDGWRFCPRCGEATEKVDGRVECPVCGFVAYANSAPTVSALVTDDENRILLARRAIEPFRGCWDIPGGFLEEGEHPLDALRRELREETGLEVDPVDFLGVFMDTYGEPGEGVPATLNLFWTARIVAGAPSPADDVDELRWFPADDLPPPEQLAFRLIPDVLSAWRNQYA